MTNPTTPFSWQMPQSTDLVTDLPADFETFGQAVATSMADLLGGTTGQILSKASNTDMDFTWVTNDVGDITAVTAGTGISGGGTSGAVTITNSMATEIAAKGDLIVGTGSATFDNLGVGTNGQVLTADSTVSPTGLKWATPATSTPTFVGAKVYNNANFTLTNNAYTLLTFNSESFDTDAFHSTSTNTSRLTIPTGKAGKYRVSFTGLVGGQAASTKLVPRFYKNGSGDALAAQQNAYTDDNSAYLSTMYDLIAGDYIEIYLYQNAGTQILNAGPTFSWFEIQYLGA